MTQKTGGCLCGRVRFTATGVDLHQHACHCTMCRRWTGGPFFSAGVEAVTFEGTEHIARFQASDWAERAFCRVCGSSLFYWFKPQASYGIATGAFDDQSDFTLADETFIEQKPPGYALAGDRPRLTGDDFLAQVGLAKP